MEKYINVHQHQSSLFLFPPTDTTRGESGGEIVHLDADDEDDKSFFFLMCKTQAF